MRKTKLTKNNRVIPCNTWRILTKLRNDQESSLHLDKVYINVQLTLRPVKHVLTYVSFPLILLIFLFGHGVDCFRPLENGFSKPILCLLTFYIYLGINLIQ